MAPGSAAGRAPDHAAGALRSAALRFRARTVADLPRNDHHDRRCARAGGRALRPGAGGGGVAVDKKTGARTYMRMGSAGAGLTFGASKYDVVILFETADKFQAFAKGGWDSSATAQAAAGNKTAEISSTFFDGVAYYQIGTKGIMASADVSGTKFWVTDLNEKK